MDKSTQNSSEEQHYSEDIHQQGLNALTGSLRTSFVWLYALVIVMIVTIVARSFFIVKPHEVGLIYRFGQLRAVKHSGLHFVLPYPLEETEVVAVERKRSVKSDSFMYSVQKSAEVTPFLTPGVDGFLITGDRNIIHVKTSLIYTVSSDTPSILDYFVYTVDAEKILRRILDSAVLTAASSMKTDEILHNVDKFRSRIASSLRLGVEKTSLGIVFENKNIIIEKNTPPRQAKAAFDALNQADQKQERRRNEAVSYSIKTVKKSESLAEFLIAKAFSSKIDRVSSAKTAAGNFQQRLKQFLENPELIKRSIYEDTLFRIMRGVDEKFIVTGSDKSQIRILLSRALEKEKNENDNSNK